MNRLSIFALGFLLSLTCGWRIVISPAAGHLIISRRQVLCHILATVFWGSSAAHHVPNRTPRISCLASLAQSIYFPDTAINRFPGSCVSGYITFKRKGGGGGMAWA
jgi:hypothetical protein